MNENAQGQREYKRISASSTGLYLVRISKPLREWLHTLMACRLDSMIEFGISGGGNFIQVNLTY